MSGLRTRRAGVRSAEKNAQSDQRVEYPHGGRARRTALITGASSGIGRAMAEVVASEGFDVLALARRKDRLHEVCDDIQRRYGVRAEPIVADLSVPGEPARIVGDLSARNQSIDLLVNNAASSRHGDFVDVPWDFHAQRLHVVVNAVLELTHLLTPGMIDRSWGRIINVGSLAGTFPTFPGDALYCASKAMLQRFSQSLNDELRGTGVACTLSVPGFTDTEIFVANGYGDIAARPGMRRAMMAPEVVARQAFDAAMGGKPVVTHGLSNKLISTMMTYSPLTVRHALCHLVVRASNRLVQT